jgi:hypothetical protein
MQLLFNKADVTQSNKGVCITTCEFHIVLCNNLTYNELQI